LELFWLLAGMLSMVAAAPMAAHAASSASASSAATGRVVSAEVALADSLRGQVANGQTLFIFAKSVDAPGIPLAVHRSAVGAWPVKILIDRVIP
jgi:cytochrome c-type biogenesis protein CcmH